jgi:hypothetical protein
MKRRLILLVAMTAVASAALIGCSNNNIDTAKLRQSFQSISGDARNSLDVAFKAIDESNYVAALRPLRTVAYKAKLDKQQSAILEETIAKVEAKAAKQK